MLTLNTDPTPLLSVYFSYDLHSLPSCSYIAGCFRLLLSLQPPADAGSPLANFSTLKLEAIRSPETSVDKYVRSIHFKFHLFEIDYKPITEFYEAADSRPATRQYLRLTLSSKNHYLIHISPLQDYILSQISPIHICTIYFFIFF
jgi:hypothetical protein